MSKQTRVLPIILTLLVVLTGFQCRKTGKSDSTEAVSPAPPAVPGVVVTPPTYTADIIPILEQNCFGCHAWMKTSQSLMERKSMALETRGLPIVYPSKPDSSVIVWRVEGKLPSGKQTERMPKGGSPLPAETIEKIRSWIEQGAPAGQVKE